MKLSSNLKLVQELIYNPCNIELTDLIVNKENIEYCACSFELDGKKVIYRESKITPTKNGQFVSIWKRIKNGETAPFDNSDKIDFIVITARSGDDFGQFIFPKLVLVDKGIITKNENEGKRGIRVYPPWDIPISKQAKKTQSWQQIYFLTIKKDCPINQGLVNDLLFLEN